jgi:hypothetical protein
VTPPASSFAPVKTFQCPGDPTLNANQPWTSYGHNSMVFSWAGVSVINGATGAAATVNGGSGGIPRSMADGTSTTIMFVQRLANCPRGGARTYYNTGGFRIGNTVNTSNPNSTTAVGGPTYFEVGRTSATCANVTLPLDAAGATGNPTLCPSTGFAGVLLAGLGDASVRGISPGVSQDTMTRACHPADGMPNGSDW